MEKRIPHYLSDSDREWIRQRLIDRQLSQVALAQTAGVTRQTVYMLLSGAARSTIYWDEIVSALGGSPPTVPVQIDDPRLAELVQLWPQMSDDDRDLIEITAKRLAIGKS